MTKYFCDKCKKEVASLEVISMGKSWCKECYKVVRDSFSTILLNHVKALRGKLLSEWGKHGLKWEELSEYELEKLVCLDEVYETIYDCKAVRVAPALLII